MNFKEQTGLKGAEKPIAMLISMCFEARNKTHIAHLKTRSYAEHMALFAFYIGIVGLADAVAEAYQGKYGIISDYPTAILSGSGVDVVKGLRTWIEKNRNKVSSDSNIQNDIDAIISLCDATIYKLEFLK